MRKELRPVYFTAPETGLRTGGYSAEVDAMNLVSEFCEARLLTYEKRCAGHGFLDDALAEGARDAIFFVHWGPDVPGLVKRLQGRNVVYHAHSTGYGFNLPVDVPIVAVSHHSLAYWGAQAPASPLFYVPNVMPERFANWHGPRDVDVLLQSRKSSKYLIRDLVPELQKRLKVTVIEDWVGDMVVLYNRAKVYLYDSSDYWHNRGVSEGFGLPPLEAIACGCSVFSSVNHALADYLNPGVTGGKLRCASLDYDVSRICKAVESWRDAPEEPPLLREFRSPAVKEAWQRAMLELNDFFDARPSFTSLIDPADRLGPPPRAPGRGALGRIRGLGGRIKRLVTASTG
jgi:Glycosyl transferases group 1